MRAFTCFVLLAALGCKSAEEAECRLNSDCPVPERCKAGTCVPECRENRDCPLPSEICERGACTPKDPGVRICARQADCPQGEACKGGVCEPVSFVSSDAGGVPTPDAGGTAPDSGMVAADSGVQAGLPYGAVCTRAGECASGLCLGPQGASAGRCTRSCAVQTDCFYPDRCVDVPGAGLLCGPTAAGKAPGEPCPSGPQECASGLCLTVATGPVCTQQCSPLPSCPAGLACAPVPDGQGGAVAVCVPGSGGGFGEPCAAGADCATNLCVGAPGAASGLCTSLCDTVPCPVGYACAQVDDGQGGVVPICAAQGAAGGGFGASCGGAADCGSGLCLSDARSGAAFCTVGCAGDADCAAVSGLVCVVLSGGEQVCGPP